MCLGIVCGIFLWVIVLYIFVWTILRKFSWLFLFENFVGIWEFDRGFVGGFLGDFFSLVTSLGFVRGVGGGGSFVGEFCRQNAFE